MSPDPVKTDLVPVLPIKVSVIEGTGDGGAKLLAGEKLTATTPDHLPNVIISVITPVAAILIRFINTFLTGLLGILTGAMATHVITASDFVHLVYKCAGLAVAGAGIGFIKDCVTVFGKLETKYPLATGNV